MMTRGAYRTEIKSGNGLDDEPESSRPSPVPVAEVARELVRPRRGGPVAGVYQWRYEILLVAGVPLVALAVERLLGLTGLVVTALAVAAVPAAWPAARRFLVDRVRAVLVEHRLRTAFARIPDHELNGRLPTILRATPRDGGTRVVVWCPPGVDAAMIDAQRPLLARYCGADDVLVEPHPDRKRLVRVFVLNP